MINKNVMITENRLLKGNMKITNKTTQINKYALLYFFFAAKVEEKVLISTTVVPDKNGNTVELPASNDGESSVPVEPVTTEIPTIEASTSLHVVPNEWVTTIPCLP